MDPSALKRAAAVRALDFVESGMKLGLGTGSTAEAFLDVLAPRVQGGLRLTCTATSERTARKASTLGIPLADLDALAPLDLVVDGADEADRDFNLIKGGGGALLREKIVAASAKRMVVIADSSKLVDRLGEFPLPVEVISFGHETTVARIAASISRLGYSDRPITLRGTAIAPFVTDSGNMIYDVAFGAILDVPKLADALCRIPGVVDQGLFVGLAHTLVIARADGIEIIARAQPSA
ncbi:MAG: ribose-5-phosphate isomerase RpiA [Rhizomicrobium sp.]